MSIHLIGGYGTCWNVSMPQEFREVLYTEPVPQPRKAEPGVWYEHAVDCPCGAAGSGRITEGDHFYRSKLAVET